VIRHPLLIDQQREIDSHILAEQARVFAISQPDRGYSGSALFESALMLAQLRDVLAAENSAVVPEKHYYR
jgi:hypothetical protein